MLADLVDGGEDGEGVTAEGQLNSLQKFDHLTKDNGASPGI